jgi:chorismate lyase
MSQSVQAIRFSEQRTLKLNIRQRALVREVTLLVNDTAWVYARTIIPLGTLKGKLRYLRHLGNRPLGEKLFVNPTMQREGTMFATISSEHLPSQLRYKQALGGRRTLFKLNNKPLLVCEIFLAAIYDNGSKSLKRGTGL